MSQIYRNWTLMRLKHLAPWIHRWALPQMYAGIPEQGAEQAWWQLSLCLEYWRSRQTQATGSATDIYNCFDKSVRPLVYTIAESVAGIPTRILHSVRQHHGSIADTYSLTVGYGAPYTRRRGTPQGCPFFDDVHRPDGQTLDNSHSEKGAIPRVLAHDLHLVAAGEHCENYLEAIRDTHIFITTAGGRIAASKSYAYSTDRRTRKRPHNTRYDMLQYARVPVVTHCEDLGGQLNMTERVMAPTLTKRISKTTRSIRKMGGIPTATKRKARLLRATSFTEAMYAGSISPANKTRLRTTQSAIINAVCPRGFPMRSPGLAARAFSDIPTKDFDLNTAIITNAIRIFRRMTQSSECNDRVASGIVRHYITQACPPRANGPIAVIFDCVLKWGAEIDENFWFQDDGRDKSQR